MKKKERNSIGDKNGDGTHHSVNFGNPVEKENFRALLDEIQKAYDLPTLYDAAAMLTVLGRRQLSSEKISVNRPEFVGMDYRLIELQTKSLLRRYRNSLENCDQGMTAFKEECDNKVKNLSEELETEKVTHKSELEEIHSFNKELETENVELNDLNDQLKAENGALRGLKEANDRAVSAWESEKQLLNEQISSLETVTKENNKLISQIEASEAEVANLHKSMSEIKHKHEIELKNSEIEHQKLVSEIVERKVGEVEKKMQEKLKRAISEERAKKEHAFEMKLKDLEMKHQKLMTDTVESKVKQAENLAQQRLEQAVSAERAKAADEIKRLEAIITQSLAREE